jgi:uncharacterized protein YkwD
MRYLRHHRQIPGLFLAWLILSVTACAHQPDSGTYSLSNLSPFERTVFKEINRARTHPADYAVFLADAKAQYDTLLPSPAGERSPADDFLGPLYEAMQVLRASTPLPALALSRGLSMAAREHLHDQGLSDRVSHTGSDGSTLEDRVKRYGAWEVGIGENIAYGSNTAQRLVMQLVIDQSNPGRNYRLNILNPAFSVSGIACANALHYRNMCIIIFAGKYHEHTAAAQ